MFDVGFWEIILIFGLGLMILGPEKLPRIAAQVGRWVGRARRTASQLRYQLEREIDLGDKPRYTPPPKASHIVPPPGRQPERPEKEAAPADAAPSAETATPGEPGASETKPESSTGT